MHRIGLCFPGRQDAFYGTDLVAVAGREPLLSWVRTQSSCPIFQSTVPMAHGSVSLFLRADFATFSVPNGNNYVTENAVCCLQESTKAHIEPYPKWKERMGKKTENVNNQLCQSESLSSYLKCSLKLNIYIINTPPKPQVVATPTPYIKLEHVIKIFKNIS